jgi:hypothetical protein
MNPRRHAAWLIALWPLVGQSQHDSLVGEWRLTLTLAPGPAITTGILSFEREGGGLAAYVDGGPVPLEIDGDELAFTIDYRDGGGRLLAYELSGRIEPRRLGGTLVPPLDAPAGTWNAIPEPPPESAPAAPVDLSGVWSRTSGGINKVELDYTAAAQAAVDEYDYLDDPALRCVSPGLVRLSGWPYPLEIIQEADRIVVLYESFHEVRRIDLDGRGYPEDLLPRSMGYSVGHWEGSTLVVETELLSESLVDFYGQPVSEDARVVERMYLEDDGASLVSELTLYDPVNYGRPVTKHRRWTRTPATTILEYDCDPYPFFRGLALEGRLDEYWERMRQR